MLQKSVHAFSQRQSVKCSSMMMFFCVFVERVQIRGPRSTFVIIPFSTSFFSFLFVHLSPLLACFLVMQVMNFKLKGGLKLLTHVCMQIFPFLRTLACCAPPENHERTNTAVPLVPLNSPFSRNNKKRATSDVM
jgi:hypothetical protein